MEWNEREKVRVLAATSLVIPICVLAHNIMGMRETKMKFQFNCFFKCSSRSFQRINHNNNFFQCSDQLISVGDYFLCFFFAEFSRAHFYCQKYHSIVSKWVKLNEIEQGLSSERTNGFFAVQMKSGFNIDRESEMLISISITFSMKSLASQRHYYGTSTKLPTNPPPIMSTNCLQMHSHNTKIITMKERRLTSLQWQCIIELIFINSVQSCAKIIICHSRRRRSDMQKNRPKKKPIDIVNRTHSARIV